MTDDEKALHYGRLVMSGIGEIKKAESDLPEWAEVDEYSANVRNKDGEHWIISIKRGSDEDDE